MYRATSKGVGKGHCRKNRVNWSVTRLALTLR